MIFANIYIHFLENSHSIDTGFYNAGFENVSILEIANLIKEKLNCKIDIKPLMIQEVTDKIQQNFKNRLQTQKEYLYCYR